MYIISNHDKFGGGLLIEHRGRKPLMIAAVRSSNPPFSSIQMTGKIILSGNFSKYELQVGMLSTKALTCNRFAA